MKVSFILSTSQKCLYRVNHELLCRRCSNHSVEEAQEGGLKTEWKIHDLNNFHNSSHRSHSRLIFVCQDQKWLFLRVKGSIQIFEQKHRALVHKEHSFARIWVYWHGKWRLYLLWQFKNLWDSLFQICSKLRSSLQEFHSLSSCRSSSGCAWSMQLNLLALKPKPPILGS